MKPAASSIESPKETLSAATSSASEVGSDVTFDQVVLRPATTASHGRQPTLSGASVTGTVLRQAKDKKILVFRYKPKKRVRKLNGHRQPFAEVKITKITLP